LLIHLDNNQDAKRTGKQQFHGYSKYCLASFGDFAQLAVM